MAQGGVLDPETGVIIWSLVTIIVVPVVLAIAIGLSVRAFSRSRGKASVVDSLRSDVARLEAALNDSENRVLELAERAAVAERLLEERTVRTKPTYVE